MSVDIKKLIFSDTDCVPLDQFISSALYHKDYGYYMTKVPFGRGGDFITSADISQLFGEVVAVWLLQYLLSVQINEKFIILELGPGRGTLISDVIRVLKKFPQYEMLQEVYLIEISPLLRDVQRRVIGEDVVCHKKVSWHSEIPDLLPQCPIIVMANEFFDALPVKQFIFLNGKTYENHVVNRNGILDIIPVLSSTLLENDGLEEGSVVERCDSALRVIKRVEEIIVKQGGAGLIIDYGYVNPWYKSTIQAVKNHNHCDFLEHVGECDISAYVDFGALQRSLRNVECTLVTQKDFLNSYGVRERLNILLKNATEEQVLCLKSAYLRLTENMGTLFKALLLQST